MLQRNSIFNYFNFTDKILTKNNIFINFINANNTTIILFFKKKVFDRFNYHGSFYAHKKVINKPLSLNFFYNFFIIQWGHISFKGKSYRIKSFKKFRKFTFNFGYSHWTKLKFAKMWKFFRRHRQKYLVYTFKWKSFKLFQFFFRYIRVMNRYTLRGLRLTKQPIKRRFGKISQHISILH